MFDGKVPHWYHFSCFWKVGHTIWQPDVEVDGFSELRWDDQQKVKKTAEAGGVTGAYTPGGQQVSLPTPELTGSLFQESGESSPACPSLFHTCACREERVCVTSAAPHRSSSVPLQGILFSQMPECGL